MPRAIGRDRSKQLRRAKRTRDRILCVGRALFPADLSPISRRQGPHAGKSGSGGLALVVAHETVERREVDGCRDVDRVQCAERGLGECSRCQEQGAFERQEGDPIKRLMGAGHQYVQDQTSVMGSSTPDRPRHLGQHELARDDVRIGQECP
jgi:hypothetical protein